MGFSAGLAFDVTGEGNVDTGKPGAGLIVPVVVQVFYRPDIARKRRGRTLTRVVVLRGQANICAGRRQRKQTFSRCP